MVGRTLRVTKAPTRFQDDEGKLSLILSIIQALFRQTAREQLHAD